MTPAERKAFAATIRPAVKGQSDKFSWRVHQRALKRGREQIFIMAWSDFTGEPFTPDFEALKRGEINQCARLMIGKMDDERRYFSGRKLYSVTRRGEAYDSCYGYGRNFNLDAWLDVTEWFWTEYQRRGRCIIHPSQVHSWLKINANARKCVHCGKHERRTVHSVKKIERKEVWS